MKSSNKTIIDAIIKKAEALYPDSLALIGIYGSAAARDEHEKSDLDLMILINDMIHEIAAGIKVDALRSWTNLIRKILKTMYAFLIKTLSCCLAEYEKVGMRPKHYGGVKEFEKDYFALISKISYNSK